MRTVTVDNVLSWSPCWDESRVRATLAPLGARFGAREILGLTEVAAEDRLWAVLRRELLDERTLRLFACHCSRRALDRERAAWREPDARSWSAVEVAERHARGEATDEELSAAWSAAWSAWSPARSAWSAADAAWSADAAAAAAARSAADAAAAAAARSAADAAADDAAWSAARSAAWSAEREAQVRDLLTLIDAEVTP